MTKKFKEIAALWKAEKRQAVKPSSYAAYICHLHKHILPALGERRTIREEDIRSIAATLERKGLAARSVHSIMLVVKMILRFAEKRCGWPHIDSGVRFSAATASSPQTLTREQQHRLTGYLRTHPSLPNIGILLSICTGLRIGEICGLRWSDVDLRLGVLRVERTVQRIWIRDGSGTGTAATAGTGSISGIIIGPPKTPTSRREVPLLRELLPLLRQQKGKTPADFYLLSGGPNPMEPRALRGRYRRLMARLGLPPVRFHGLRHNFATRCVESHCDYKTLSAILGHSSIYTTLNLYVHPDITQKRHCVERMAKAAFRAT